MGNFDGLHRGHALLIGRARDLARAQGRPAGVLTFEPHPRSVFVPAAEPFRLTPFRVKERELARLGVDLLFVQHFDARLCRQERRGFSVRDHRRGDRRLARRRRLGLHLWQGPPRHARSAARRRSRARLWRHRDRTHSRRRRDRLFLDPHPRALEGRQAARGGGPARPVLGNRRPGRGRRPARADDRLSDRQSRARRLSAPGFRGLRGARVGRRPGRPVSPAARSTASPISVCARPSARSSRGSKRICSTSTPISTAGICAWRSSTSSVPSRNSPGSTR